MQERVLIVDDDQAVRSSLRRYLQRHGFDVDEADSCRSAEARFRAFAPTVALIDYRLPDGEALALLPRLRHIDPSCTIFVLTGHGTIDIAVRAVKEGAAEFLTKPLDMPALLKAVQIGVRASRAGLARTGIVEPLFTDAPSMKALRACIDLLRTNDESVLFVGEDGSGRATMARWLHATGRRSGAGYVEVPCGADTAERELFGFEQAGTTSRPGVIEAVGGGSLYLREIETAAPTLQARLLGFLRTRRFHRSGEGGEPREADVRVIASTSTDLVALAAHGAFDAELARWFASRIVHVPALAEQPESVVPLARHLLARLATRHGRGPMDLTPDAELELFSREWPGNVRELENVLESAMLLTSGRRLTAVDLRVERRPSSSEPVTLEEVERRAIQEALREEGGKVEAAAKRLGIPRSTLYYKLKQMAGKPPRDVS